MNKTICVIFKLCIILVLLVGQSITTHCETIEFSYLHKTSAQSQVLTSQKMNTNHPLSSHRPLSAESNSEIEEESEKIHDEKNYEMIGRMVFLRIFQSFPSYAIIKILNDPNGIWKPPQIIT